MPILPCTMQSACPWDWAGIRKEKENNLYQFDFKMACCAFKRSFSSNDNSDASFEKMLVNIAYYLTPIRPGRKDQRNMKAKMVIGFPYRLSASA